MISLAMQSIQSLPEIRDNVLPQFSDIIKQFYQISISSKFDNQKDTDRDKCQSFYK